MADVTYNRGKYRIASKAVDWTKVRMLLLESRSTSAGADENPDLNTVGDILGVAGVAEMVATNYARQAVANVTFTQDDTNDRAVIDSDDVVFANLGVADGSDGIVRAAVLYERIGASDANTDPILRLFDIADTVTNGQNFTVTTPNGLFRLT